MTLYVSFSPMMDHTIRTSLPTEVRIALCNHKALFYLGGLVLNVTSSIPLPPATLFHLVLLTSLCLHQGDAVPTPTERPRTVSDVIADVPPQGHAPWLPKRIRYLHIDHSEGHRPLPWLTPSLTQAEGTISWTSSGNVRSFATTPLSHSAREWSSMGNPSPIWLGRAR